ncbi:MAG: hypothetical protein CVV64_08740 [Candidatus Wallbacteria bacterium HGW-Wallbacteria-1]|uniref:Uncharacterized protein n=1 Tax=Candidatus Wallbacteria bacterium HGW-Wallbacteria-1 TaxID=2013854 RepID=A0A2N1PQ83_9BACT|nr:MAG: hypothetical protein CVV64_08740 [Candidatus Wallbacteria bacterium HGW-Wallbacteria-1]
MSEGFSSSEKSLRANMLGGAGGTSDSTPSAPMSSALPDEAPFPSPAPRFAFCAAYLAYLEYSS